MAIQVSGTEVISNARALNNIASIDATTAASIGAAGVGGKILQVVSTLFTGAEQTSSTTMVASAFNLSITPTSASSKILVMVAGGNLVTQGTYNYAHVTIYRNSTTNLFTWGSVSVVGDKDSSNLAMTVLDSPATTSSVNYKIYYCTNQVAYPAILMAGAPGKTPKASMTLMEIAG
jgi:hypothetical protein